MLLPLFVPLAVLSLLAGRLTARYGARPVMLGAAVVAAGGQLCLLLISVNAGCSTCPRAPGVTWQSGRVTV
jgi:MFS transporter, DHA2 family, methylenomycin A resistance protein